MTTHGVLSFFELQWQGWYFWVTLGSRVGTNGWVLSLTSLSLGTAFVSKISVSLMVLQPHSSAPFLLQSAELREKAGSWVTESSAGQFRSELSCSLSFYWVSSNWDFMVFIFFFQHHLLSNSSKSMAELPCNGLFSCWVEQYCCHMLKATINPRRCMSKTAAILFLCWQM